MSEKDVRESEALGFYSFIIRSVDMRAVKDSGIDC